MLFSSHISVISILHSFSLVLVDKSQAIHQNYYLTRTSYKVISKRLASFACT